MLELARLNTGLGDEELEHLHHLVASWQVLADLSFSDLLLLAPVAGEAGRSFVVLAQVRPTTGPTSYPEDLVGRVVDEIERPLVARTWHLAEITSGIAPLLGSSTDMGERARLQCVPVRWRERPVAVVSREAATAVARRPGELERQYLEVFDRLARMIVDGTFPFAQGELELEEAPRVGDGVVVIDRDRRVRFVSPNAVSALHRMGIHSNTTGLRLGDVGFDQSAIDVTFRSRAPVMVELQRGEAEVLVHALPLLEGTDVEGGIVMLRDITDLRHRDRMLVSKDATIREVHHRVKNNLQTIAALLRLQARRLQSDEARAALEESERRIRSIAVVHETLSRDASDVVAFDDIVQPLARLIEESAAGPDSRIRFFVEGDAGELPGELATPLAVVLNELLQNAVDHAFPPSQTGACADGTVRVTLAREHDEVVVDVVDDGIGLPEDFDLATGAGLGLSIVQTLVTTEMGGAIELHDDHGTRARLRVPVRPQSEVGR
jgi:two-component sensor histidine kinase